MSTVSETGSPTAEALSALADGELDAAGVADACGRWRGDASARATWHAYQLIGDVLRSEDLATDAARDAAFLRGLSARLAAEPVVLAPQPLETPHSASNGSADFATRRRRWAWAGPSAVAAGFMAVAGVLVVTQGPAMAPTPQPGATAGATALQGSSVSSVRESVAVQATPVASARPEFVDGKVIRDAGLDRYLAAHKHFAGSTALGVPSPLLRSATVDLSGR